MYLTALVARRMLGQTTDELLEEVSEVASTSTSYVWSAFASLKRAVVGPSYQPLSADGEECDDSSVASEGYSWPTEDSPTAAGRLQQRPDVPVEELGSTTAAQPLTPGQHLPKTSHCSDLLTQTDLLSLASAVPLRHKWRDWQLVYSSGRDGISLKTLYRNAAGHKATILVVRDTGQYVFGCFASEAWHVAPRYYGTGECFVFQLQPQALMWRWWQKKNAQVRNDFYQFSTNDALAMGGAPNYALRLDSELAGGSSGVSETFGSPCIASQSEFSIGRVELWAVD